ncbi:hypothetical protein HPB50_013727 [Hyalomma asiaticum]|uniref:Uncharacterized protein n=1 Tax=Hyalomma asiaticum TaxID=266040 RepID=A0ACB7SH35_HYAAI|nr:hypothetical protein HPB50_013727 [Hyalomma asiaticum]
MKGVSSDDVHSKRTTREADVTVKTPKSRHREVSRAGEERTASKTAAATATKRSKKKSKKDRRPDPHSSSKTFEPVGVAGAGIQSAAATIGSTTHPIQELGKHADPPSGIVCPVISSGHHAASVELSPGTAPNEATGGPAASAHSFGLPTQKGAEHQSAGAVLSDRVPDGADSMRGTIAEATGVQARDAGSRPSNGLAAAVESAERKSPESVAVGSPMAEIEALLRSTSPGTTLSPNQQTFDGQSSVCLRVVTQQSPGNPASSRRQRRYKSKPRKQTEDFVGMEKLCEMSIHRPGEDAKKSRRLLLVLPAVSVVVLIGLASIVFLMMTRNRMDANTTGEPFCTSGSCVMHADIIGLSDVYKDQHQGRPCDDFGSFICSFWKKRHKEKVARKYVTRSVLTDAFMDHIVSLEKFGVQEHVLAISQRPARMMDACLLRRPSDDKEALDQLLDFMHRTGIGFPGDDIDKSDYSRPLHMLVDLAYNWALPLWFFVDLVIPRNSTASHAVVSLRHSSLGDLYNSLQEAIEVYEEVYLFYVNTILEVVYGGTVEASFKHFTNESKLLQKHVFANLSRLSRSIHNPVLLTVKRLPYFVVNTSVEDWLGALRPLKGFQQNAGEDTVVYIADREMLVVMSTFFQAYSARELYLHIHWWFVQIFGAIVSNTLFDAFRRDPERGPLMQNVICSVQVNLNYNAVLASETRAHQESSISAKAVAALKNVHSAAVSKVSSAMGARLALLLEEMEPFLWPTEQYASDDGLLRLYGNATTDNKEPNFFQLWLSRAVSYQQSWASLKERSSEASIFKVDASLLTSHHIMSKVVSLSLAVIKAPLYYPDATSAIIYGGLGFIYATEIVRVLNSLSLLLDGGTTIVPSEAGFSQSYVSAPYSCAGMDVADIYPMYMALELAYASYRQFRDDTEDVRLWNAKGYTPEQIFFATVCYTMCDMDRGAVSCTTHMKHFPEFATAFSCPPSLSLESCDVLH